MVRVEYGVVRVEYEKNQTRRHPRDKTHPRVAAPQYEVLTRVDEFCRVDGAEFDFVHISCRAEYGKWYIGIIPR